MFTIINYLSFVVLRIAATSVVYFALLKIRLILYGRTTFVGDCTRSDSCCYFWAAYNGLSSISSKRSNIKIMIKLILKLAIYTAIRTFNWVQTKDQIYEQYTILHIIKFDEEDQILIAKRCTFYVISLN
jgi:hypothetical protein